MSDTEKLSQLLQFTAQKLEEFIYANYKFARGQELPPESVAVSATDRHELEIKVKQDVLASEAQLRHIISNFAGYPNNGVATTSSALVQSLQNPIRLVMNSTTIAIREQIKTEATKIGYDLAKIDSRYEMGRGFAVS